MPLKTKLKKVPLLSVFSFCTALIISDAVLYLCYAEKQAGKTIDPGHWTTVDPGHWTTIKEIPEPAPTPQPAPAPYPKHTPESEPPPLQLPHPTSDQLASCFAGCIPIDENCKIRCFQEWQRAGGR